MTSGQPRKSTRPHTVLAPIIRAAVELSVWMFSIPLYVAFITWLSRSKRIETPDWIFQLICIAFMPLWALWIFQKNFQYLPVNPNRIIYFCIYLLMALAATYVGVVMAYLAVVLFLGGE